MNLSQQNYWWKLNSLKHKQRKSKSQSQETPRSNNENSEQVHESAFKRGKFTPRATNKETNAGDIQ